MPFISVIMPVRNEAAFIRSTLEQLLSQEYPSDRFEILVADGESTDATREIVADLMLDHPNLRLLDNPGRWSSAGRNAAVRAARGELMVLIDGHCEINNPDYLAEIAASFERSWADCVGRPQPQDVSDASPLQCAIALARSSRLGHHPASFIWSDADGFVPPHSVAVAYRREVFDKIGFFDETFDACEDVEFNHRIAEGGLTCYFSPRLEVRYFPRENLRGLFRQMVRYGRGRIRLIRKHPETMSLLPLLPAFFLLGAIVGPLMALVWPVLGWIYAGALAVYAMTVLAFSIQIARRERNRSLFPRLAVVFPTIHLGAGWGLLLEAVRGSRSTRRAESGRPGRGVVRLSSPEARARIDEHRPRIVNALTVDVEDYFNVSGFENCVSRAQWDDFPSRVAIGTNRILSHLAEANVRATFFVLGWVAEREPDLVRTIQRAGHEVGCHSYWHRLVYQQTPEEFRADLCRGRDVLEDILGAPVRAYRAPSFSVMRKSLWALDILAEEGFVCDSSIYPTRHDRYGIAGSPLEPHRIDCPAGTLWEFPPPVWRVLGYPLPIGGGGYLRLFPYRLTRRGLRAINAGNRPCAVYLHPWELDPEQPRLRPGLMRGFRHYVNLHKTEERLASLLRDFAFGTMTNALEPLLEPTPAKAAAYSALGIWRSTRRSTQA